MKERPIIFTTELIPKILDGTKTQTRRVVTPNNSEVGEGRSDWGKFDWEGKSIHIEECFCPDCKTTHKHQAPLPFTDGKPETGQYLHVPYNWEDDMTIFRIYPKWEGGDRLWVREAFMLEGEQTEEPKDRPFYNDFEWGLLIPHYKATEPDTELYDDEDKLMKWSSPRFMKRWASRITLEITGIRVERLQEISQSDIKAEGIDVVGPVPINSARLLYKPKNDTELVTMLFRDEFAGLWDSLNAKRGYPWESNPWVWVIEFKKLNG